MVNYCYKVVKHLNFRKAVQGLGTAFAVLLLCLPAFSQGSTGRILGTITDSNGGSVAGATVTVLDVNRGTTRTLTTDATGAYNAPNLLPGTYTVSAKYKGFKGTERQNIVLGVAQEVGVNLVLQPGETSQTITVTEQAPLIQTTNATLGGALENKTINDLPLNGRNFENLLDLRPGVTKYVGNSGWTQSSNGLRPHDNMFLVEGVDSNDPWMAQSMMNAVMAAGDAGTMLPIDAIDEFKTEQNPRAEYGWKPGAVVNVGIKSGTNTIHGSLYAYGRNASFDAKNFFTQPTDPAVPLSLEQFGASAGGAIVKDKLFYFGNFEEQRYTVGNPVVHTVPNTSPTALATDTNSLVGACQAVLNGGGTVAPLSATLAGITVAGGTCTMGATPGVFPVSNGSNSLTTSLASVNRIDAGVGKLDYTLNDKNSFTGMYFRSPGEGTYVDDPTHQVLPGSLTVQTARSQVVSFGWTYIPSSKWVNSFRFGWSHYNQSFLSADSNVDPTTYGINTGVTDPTNFGFPRLRIKGFNSFQLGASWPKTVGPDTVWQFSDNISYLAGNHTIKFGGEVLINQSTNDVTANTKGPLQFATLADFFTGNIQNAQITVGNFKRQLQSEGFAAFVQDDWRVTPRLTLNLGLRYELNTVVTEKNNQIGNFDPTLGLIQAGVGGVGRGVYNGDHNNFGPRFGFAWDVFGDSKTVVRGGASVLYEQGSFDSLMALGNLLGLRTEPTGVNIYTCSDNSHPGDPCPTILQNPVTTAGGSINLGAVRYSGAALGPLDTNWQNNSPTVPLYSASPACGDGTILLGNGTVPQPCTILGVDKNLRTPYITTWSLGIQRALTNNLSLDVTYVGNHATKLVGLIDLNQPPMGTGWTAPFTATQAADAGLANTDVGLNAGQVCLGQGAEPAYSACAPNAGAMTLAQPYQSRFPYLGYIEWLSNNNHSNYNSLQVAVTERATHGLSFVLGYTYAHALGMSPDNWSFISPTDNANNRSIYGTTEFDIRHRFTMSTTYDIPGMNAPAQLLKGWSLNSIVTLQSATPWGINDVTTDFSGTNEINSQSPNGEQWNFYGNPSDFKTTKAFIGTNFAVAGDPTTAQGGIPYYSGTTSPLCLAQATANGPLAVAALSNLGCYVNGSSILIPPAYGTVGNTAPNMFRSFPYYNVDLNVTKTMKFGERVSAQFRVEFFNIFNHPNIANVFGGPGGDNTFTDPTAGAAGNSFGFRNQTPDVTSSNPVLGSGGPRAMQLGLKILF